MGEEEIKAQGEQMEALIEALAKQQNDKWRNVGGIIQALLIPIVLAGIFAMVTTYQQTALLNQRLDQNAETIKAMKLRIESNSTIKVDIAKIQSQNNQLSSDIRDIKDDIKELKKKRR